MSSLPAVQDDDHTTNTVPRRRGGSKRTASSSVHSHNPSAPAPKRAKAAQSQQPKPATAPCHESNTNQTRQRKKMVCATSATVFHPLVFECVLGSSTQIQRLARRGGLVPAGTVGPESCSIAKPFNWSLIRRCATHQLHQKKYTDTNKPRVGSRVLTLCADMMWHLACIVENVHPGNMRQHRPPKFRIEFVEGQDMYVEIPHRDVMVLADCPCCCHGFLDEQTSIPKKQQQQEQQQPKPTTSRRKAQPINTIASPTNLPTTQSSPPIPQTSTDDRQAFTVLGIRAWDNALTFARGVVLGKSAKKASGTDGEIFGLCERVWGVFSHLEPAQTVDFDDICHKVGDTNADRVRAVLQAFKRENRLDLDNDQNLWSLKQDGAADST